MYVRIKRWKSWSPQRGQELSLRVVSVTESGPMSSGSSGPAAVAELAAVLQALRFRMRVLQGKTTKIIPLHHRRMRLLRAIKEAIRAEKNDAQPHKDESSPQRN